MSGPQQPVPTPPIPMQRPGPHSPAMMSSALSSLMSMNAQATMNQLFASQAKMHPKNISKHKFTQEEDQRLRQLVEQNENLDWRAISSQMNGRSPRQCRERWKNYLCPAVKNGPWTEQEDQLLIQQHDMHGSHWAQIAKSFPARTDLNIKNRWITRFAKPAQKGSLQAQDAKLIMPMAQGQAIVSNNGQASMGEPSFAHKTAAN